MQKNGREKKKKNAVLLLQKLVGKTQVLLVKNIYNDSLATSVTKLTPSSQTAIKISACCDFQTEEAVKIIARSSSK